jgi:hypothetical protein
MLMCTPLLTAIGTVVSAAGAVQQGRAASAAATADANAADQNAKIATRQAEIAAQNGAQEERETRRRGLAVAGAQRAAYSANGLDISSGSPLDVLTDTGRQSELDALQVRRNAANEVWGYQAQSTNYSNQANASRATAKNARRAGNMAAVGQLLTGATKMSEQFAARKSVGG